MFGAPLFSVPQAPTTPGELSDALRAETQKRTRILVPLVRIVFPPDDSNIRRAPTATTLQDAEHVVSGAATIHEALDDPFDVPDDDSSYVRSDLNDDRAESRVTFEAFPEGIVACSELRVHCRGISQVNAGASDDGSWTFGIRINGTNYFRSGVGESEAPRYFNPIYRTVVLAFPTNPDTGLAWQPSELDTIEGVFITQPDALGDQFGQRITQMFLDADVSMSTTGQFSSETVNSKSEGLYLGRVTRFDNITRSVMGKSNGIEGTSAGCEIADPFGEISTLIAKFGNNLRGAEADIRLAAPSPILPSEWKTLFKGVVKGWRQVKGVGWRFSFKPKDDFLIGVVPNVKITEFDFPNADAKLYDNFAPLVYGNHNSTNITDDGMVQLYRVDTVNNVFLVSFGRISTVVNLYAQLNNEAPILLVQGTGVDQWQRIADIDSIINGRQWTLVNFPGGFSAIDPVEMAFTADVAGFDEVGDGSGPVITNPADMLKHILVNFVFNNYQSGLWFSDDTAPIDVVKFNRTRDFLNSLGQSSSRYIGGKGNATKAKDEINRFTKNIELKVFWTSDGNIAILPNDHTTRDVYADRLTIEEGLHDLSDADFDFDDGGLISRIFVSYIHQQDGGKFLANIEIADISIENGASDSLQAFWLPSEIPGTT